MTAQDPSTDLENVNAAYRAMREERDRAMAEAERLRLHATSARVLIEHHRATRGSNHLLTTALQELDDALTADTAKEGCATMTTPLPLLVGLCPVHAGESYAPVDPADPDPKCPACGCRLLVYAPRGSMAGASDEALAGKGERDA